MFLASGKLEENNLSDYLTVQASLVAADKLYVMKKQVQTLSTYACCTHDSKLIDCNWSSSHIVFPVCLHDEHTALLTLLFSLSSCQRYGSSHNAVQSVIMINKQLFLYCCSVCLH